MMPAEWEPHDATWIAWPHHEPDWPGKLGQFRGCTPRSCARCTQHERVEILCHDERCARRARQQLDAHGVDATNVSAAHRAHRPRLAPRFGADLRPRRAGASSSVNWAFNAWAKYDNFARDDRGRRAIERITGLPRVEPHASRRRRAAGARGRRHRDRRRGHAARDRGVAALRRAGAQSRARRARTTSARSASTSASARRSGSARDASATTRTATSTTSRASSRRASSCSRTRTIPPTTRTIAGRWTTCAGSSWPARPTARSRS